MFETRAERHEFEGVLDLAGESSWQYDVVEDFSKLLLAVWFNTLTQQTISRHGGSQTTLKLCFSRGNPPLVVWSISENSSSIFTRKCIFSRATKVEALSFRRLLRSTKSDTLIRTNNWIRVHASVLPVNCLIYEKIHVRFYARRRSTNQHLLQGHNTENPFSTLRIPHRLLFCPSVNVHLLAECLVCCSF
jgi:hypothetical protein